jgi:hypothetical protein
LDLNSGVNVLRFAMWTLLSEVYIPLRQVSSFSGPLQV